MGRPRRPLPLAGRRLDIRFVEHKNSGQINDWSSQKRTFKHGEGNGRDAEERAASPLGTYNRRRRDRYSSSVEADPQATGQDREERFSAAG